MRVELEPNQRVGIRFAESDGEIEVRFDRDSILVSSDLPDSFGRVGVIYDERFGANAAPGDTDHVVIPALNEVVSLSSFVTVRFGGVMGFNLPGTEDGDYCLVPRSKLLQLQQFQVFPLQNSDEDPR